MHDRTETRVTVGALYRYYASRQSLIAALEIDCLERFEKAFEGACIPDVSSLTWGAEMILCRSPMFTEKRAKRDPLMHAWSAI